MEKILITGCSGFVAHHFWLYLLDNKVNFEVYGMDLKAPEYETQGKNLPFFFYECNMLNPKSVKNVIAEVRPDYILHLASFSSVAYSWSNPIECFQNNTIIFLNLIESVRDYCVKSRILSIGSSEEYGIVSKECIPLKEDNALNPINPYAVARVSQEMLGKIFCTNYGLDIIFTRSFNHLGKYQDTRFAIPQFVSKLKLCKEGKCILDVGNVEVIRDYIDVRDVVEAYYKLLKLGKTGEIYNVCSGNGYSLRQIIDMIAYSLDIEVELRVDYAKVRPADNPIIIGSYQKIQNSTGWFPKYSICDSIKNILQD